MFHRSWIGQNFLRKGLTDDEAMCRIMCITYGMQVIQVLRTKLEKADNIGRSLGFILGINIGIYITYMIL